MQLYITTHNLGPPQLLLPQNRTVEVNVTEEMVLNCSASSSPDPVYTWSIPHSCSSCPDFSNNSVITFTADIFSNGNYICVAENNYGSATKHVTISVLCEILSVCQVSLYNYYSYYNSQNMYKCMLMLKLFVEI